MVSNKSAVFIDTSFFKALIDVDDDFHRDSELIWKKFRQNTTPLTTTNFILDETFTLVRIRCGLEVVKELRKRLVSGLSKIKIIRIMVIDESLAWDWFLKEWKDLSFTDCVSFALMKRLSLERVATFDQHFKKAGFTMEK